MQKKIDFSERDFFINPFNREEIELLLKGRPVKDMFNTRSPSFKKLGLDKETLGAKEMMDLMTKEPRLIRRPVIQIDQEVHFGANTKVLENISGL